ncbi:MAG: TIGR00282 family metallophosphoesterase [Armatimonadetes bacterium]|nr:TIGR00282 family metallophosphoesterase [Armatimonadota bacterium]MBX3108286.1 TIGR00282 family metallophosphoesterase [Fimbriimonadaceae bacterium]
MERYRILFLGDVVGRPGRDAVLAELPSLRAEFDPLFIVVNGENAAAGMGITPKIAAELFSAGVDVVTLGNHAFNKREISPYLDSGAAIIRPVNLPESAPGRGICHVQKKGIELAVMNIHGRVFMDSFDDPFAAFDRLDAQVQTRHRFVDFHAEATSEKVAFGFHCDGRATAVVGTHTHIQTADEKVLPGGTAYITDVGMCGPYPSVIGMDRRIILQKFRTSMPARFEVADEPGVICGVVIDVQVSTGAALRIERIQR